MLEGASDLTFREVVGLPSIPLLLILYFLVFLAFNFFYISFPVHAAIGLDWSLSEVGLFFSVMGVLMVLVQGPVLKRMAVVWSERTLIAGGSLALAVSFLFFMSEDTTHIYAGTVLLACGNGLMWPSLTAVISKATNPRHQGAVQGLASSVGAVASIVGLLAGGLLYGVLGSRVFVLSFAITLLAVVMSFSVRTQEADPLS
jgi:predicted MFS family arabinose efflux permease